MKKFLLGSLLALITTVSSYGCWFLNWDWSLQNSVLSNLNSNYIAGVNNYITHFKPITSIEQGVVYENNMNVDLPITVWVKIGPRFSGSTEYKIVEATLQYRIKKSGGSWGAWKTVKTLENVTWKMEFNNKVALFGRNNINPSGLKKGDEIMIRLYLLSVDGYRTGDKTVNGPNSLSSQERETNNWSNVLENGGWTPPFIMSMKFSGNKRPIR